MKKSNRHQKKSRNIIRKVKIKKSVKLLKADLKSIKGVQNWATAYGVSSSWLRDGIKLEYGITPKRFLKNLRFQRISDHIKEDIDITGYELALETGLKDEVALSKFLRRNYDTTLIELKCKLHDSKKV